MEDTLRVIGENALQVKVFGLNPCFNGRYSQRVQKNLFGLNNIRLNPCFNGRYSQRKIIKCIVSTLQS